MNIKIAIGNVFKKLGLLNMSKKIMDKFGYAIKFRDHHANGIELKSDVMADTDLESVKTVLDVGAAIGTMSQLFLDIFPQSTVHAFEPYHVSFDRLTEDFKDNPRVVRNNIGLSDEPGEFKMFLQSDSGYNSLNKEVNKPSEDMDGKFQMVKVKTISEYAKEKNLSNIDFIKIDTEGLDLKVLKGAEDLLKAGKIKYIFVECTFDKDNTQNTSFEELNEYLQAMNFKVRAIYDQSNFGDTSYLTCVNAMFMLQPTN